MSVNHTPEPVVEGASGSWAPEQPPVYCHEERLAACKKMVYEIAEDLTSADVRSIQYHYSLPADSAPSPTLALEVLESFEKKGKFSCYDIGPLEEILKSINRHDLIMKYIVDYRQRYRAGNIPRTVSSPPQSLPQRRLPNQRSMPIMNPPNMNPPAAMPRSGLPVSEQPASLPALRAQQPPHETTAEANAGQELGETEPNRDVADHLQPSADAEQSSLDPSDGGLKMGPVASSSQVAALQEPSQASTLSSQPRLVPVTEGAGSLEQSDESWETLETSTLGEEAPLLTCHDRWRTKRKPVYSIICAHKEGKFVKLGKLALKLNCRVCPKLLLKLYPCGEGEDRNNYFATLGVEIVVPPKCWGQFDQLRVKLSARVDGRREEISAVSEINKQSFNLYGLISHMDIIRSRSPDIVIHTTAEVEYFPTENQNVQQT